MAMVTWASQEVEQFLSRIKTTDGVFAVDADQRIVYWGASAQEILGYPPEEVLGLPCHEVIGGRDARNFRFCRRNCPVMMNTRRRRPSPNYDVAVDAPSGSSRWLNMTILVLDTPRGQKPLAVHLFRDVTKRRRIEQAASRATAALGEFSAEEKTGNGANLGLSEVPGPRLTRRELEVLRLLACGTDTVQIAESLGISYITARNHISNVLTKMGARNRLQAVLYASQHHLL